MVIERRLNGCEWVEFVTMLLPKVQRTVIRQNATEKESIENTAFYGVSAKSRQTQKKRT